MTEKKIKISMLPFLVAMGAAVYQNNQWPLLATEQEDYQLSK